MPMAFRVRSSKFRHIYGNSTRKDGCYEGIKITKNAHDGNFCAVNPKFLSVVIESAGGGSFVCLPLERTGRVDANCPKVSGHKGPVLDIKWNPFNDHIIASSSDDSTVKVWKIPEHGLRTNLTDWIVDLHGHNRRVGYIEWHPTAENILLSLGYDHKCVIWNVEQAEPVNVIQKHTDTIYSAAWNRDGSLFATTCKDKMLRVIDPRCGDIISENTGHQGSKASKVLFLGDTNKLFTTGFSKMSERQYAIWDIKNMTKPMRLENVDFSSGVLLPFYDHDTRVMFLAGKGDGNIRYYELVSDAPYCHFLSQYQSSAPQRGLGAMPKRGCDASRCEIMRFYKLHADKFICEPISMIVPRRSEQFQDDIFPPTTSSIASLTADEWVSGLNREPILISMQDGEITNDPKTSASKAVQKQDGALLNAPSITTYKAIDKTRLHTHPVSAVNGLDSPEHPHYPRNRPPPMTNHVSPVVQTRSKEPDSMKNIRRLSANVGEMEVDVHLQADPHLDSVAEKMSMFENISEMSSPNSTPEKMETTKSRSSPRKRVSHGNENTPNGLGLSSETEKIHVKKVWSTPAPRNSPPVQEVIGIPKTDPELRKAYFRQVEEINSLKDQVSLKDKRIRQLEYELNVLRDLSTEVDESNC